MPNPFCLLHEPHAYIACSWDLTRDDPARRHWVDFFISHLNTILELGVAAAVVRGESAGSAAARADACREAFTAAFNRFAQSADLREQRTPITILTLDRWRDDFLRQHGFVDAFIDLKERENTKAIPLLPVVCRQIDSLKGDAQLRALIEGIFAGNIFDMGAQATAKAFLAGGPDFFATREKLPPRPWLIDHYDALSKRLFHGPRHRKAVFFIDNAGSDFLLGALPMVRWLAMRGTTVILAANERPTLNDMTIYDVHTWWPRICEAEPSYAHLPIERVSTGTGEPLIDLMDVSNPLNTAAVDADLVILEGMGRGVESNLDAAFRCDAVNLAMIKDQAVATRCGGKLYDVICRYRPGSLEPPQNLES